MELCKYEDCTRPKVSRGWCGTHYKRYQVHGDPSITLINRKTDPNRVWTIKLCALEGCERKAPAHTYCSMHRHRVEKYGDPGPVHRLVAEKGKARRIDSNGYVVVSDYKGRKGGALEHRVVMMEHLGRDLHSHESIHHINGDRSDNRLENLELWSSSQPAGQRIEDKVKWAKEILELYGE